MTARVAGMAFALGFGAALLAGNGVAQADTADTATSGPEPAATSPQSPTAKVRVKTAGARGSSGVTANAVTGTGLDRSRRGTIVPPVRLPAAARSFAAPVNLEVPGPGLSASAVGAGRAAKAPNPFFNNQTPTLAYNPLENNDANGQIEGDLHPVDADSPKLTYTATKPSLGTVAIDPDGTFVYTPGENFTGQDMFKVTVSDAPNGFHIHGFAGLINLLSFGLLGTSGHKTTETVFIGQQRTVVASGLTLPVDFRFLPDGRIVLAEKNGAIKMIGTDGTVLPTPVITLDVSTIFERGISGLAVDPQFASNGYIYVAYTTAQIKDRLSRITVTGDTAAPDSEKVLLETADMVTGTHRGGGLAFGPDGKLYWAKGDNGVGATAQDLTNLHGKILRINPDGSTPSDNPVLGQGALPQIYAYGFRNPYRLTFTPTGQLLVSDVGDLSFEEINRVTAGGNYGWPGAEGLCTSNCAGLSDPVYTYPHEPGAALTALLVRDGSKVVMADEGQRWLKVLTCNSTFTSCGSPTMFDPKAGTTVALGQDPASGDSFYQLTYLPGTLKRITLTGGPSPA